MDLKPVDNSSASASVCSSASRAGIETEISFSSCGSLSSSQCCQSSPGSLLSSTAHQPWFLAGRAAPSAISLIFEQQVQHRRPCGYLNSVQSTTGITPSHRASVVDNMTGAATKLALANESLHKGVDCLDRYLSVVPTPLHLLQPVGIACLWVAAKYEQLLQPPASSFVPLILAPSGQPLGNTPAARQLLVLLEQRILSALDYRLASGVSSQAFLDHILQQLCHLHQRSQPSAPSQQQQQQQQQLTSLSVQQLQQLCCLTSYLCELTLLEYHLLPWLPSQVAAASFAYAQVLLGLPLDTCLLQQLSGHSANDLRGVMEYMCALHSTLAAAAAVGTPYSVTLRYGSPQAHNVAAVPPIDNKDDARLASNMMSP